MRKNINKTLKEKLFISPHPVCNKKEFFQMRYRMFGDEKDIIVFLETTETLKKIEAAKKIVYRLVFQSNFAPSIELLDYLAEFESTIRYDRSIKHPSRDHYIHICYLYLLGIYLFFYAPELNEKLHISMSLIRHSEYLNEEDNFVKSFLGAWKYFVLFHDLAYPIEYLGDKTKEYNSLEQKTKREVESLYMFSSIGNGMLDILSLKTLSRIIAISNTINNLSLGTQNLFLYLERNQRQFANQGGGVDFSKYIKEKAKRNIVYLPNIKSGDDIKIFLSVFACEDFFVVLKKQSAVKCILDSQNCFVSEDCRKNKAILKIKEERRLLFQDELFEKCPDFRIEYYGIDLKEKYRTFVSDNGLQEDMLQSPKMNVSTTNNMQEMSFEIFLECYKRHGEKVNEITGKDIELNCNEILLNKLKNISVNIDEDKKKHHEYAEIYLEKYIEGIKSLLPALKLNELSMQAIDQSADEHKRITNVNFLFKKIRVGLAYETNIFDDVKDVWELYDVKRFSKIYDKLQESTKKYIEKSLQKATRSDWCISEILNDYHLEYTNYDHGITAALIFMLHFTQYQNLIEKCNVNKLLCIGFNIPNVLSGLDKNDLINQKYIKDYEKSSGQVMYAILIHNLYPNNFTNIKGMRTRLNNNPFAFFCMLCDALQNWGRPFNINPIKEDYPLFVDANKYNIKLGKYITIKFEEGDPGVVREYLEPYSETLDQYLEGASKEIRVIFK